MYAVEQMSEATERTDGEGIADGGRPDIRLDGVRKAYGDVVAVAGIDLEIARGEFFTMLGPSGSGKTTTLRMIAGFELPDAGTIELAGRDVSDLPPYDREVNTVFQDYALFPHMTVGENVEYGLRVRKVRTRTSAPQRRDEALEMVRLARLRRPQAVASSPAASASGSRSPARSSTGRGCCCSTSRSAPST